MSLDILYNLSNGRLIEKQFKLFDFNFPIINCFDTKYSNYVESASQHISKKVIKILTDIYAFTLNNKPNKSIYCFFIRKMLDINVETRGSENKAFICTFLYRFIILPNSYEFLISNVDKFYKYNKTVYERYSYILLLIVNYNTPYEMFKEFEQPIQYLNDVSCQFSSQ